MNQFGSTFVVSQLHQLDGMIMDDLSHLHPCIVVQHKLHVVQQLAGRVDNCRDLLNMEYVVVVERIMGVRGYSHHPLDGVSHATMEV